MQFDFNNLLTILFAYSVLAVLVERSLYQIFDTKLWSKLEVYVDEYTGGDYADLKPWISIVYSVALALFLKLDMFALMFSEVEKHAFTIIATGLFISGGATGVFKTFKNIRKIREFKNLQFKQKAESPHRL